MNNGEIEQKNNSRVIKHFIFCLLSSIAHVIIQDQSKPTDARQHHGFFRARQ